MIFVYGASGFTGALVTRALLARGLPVAVGGRDRQRLEALARGLPAPVEVRPAAELVHQPTAWMALGLLAGGVILLVAGAALTSPAGTRAGASGILAGSLLVAAQYVRIFGGRNTGSHPTTTLSGSP